jgi:hypothetical protein
MKKANPLAAGLQQFERAANPPAPRVSAPEPEPAKQATARPAKSREGAVQIAAFFPEDVRAQLKMLAAEQRRDVQDMLGEALNLVFAKYGKAEIAPVRSTR